MKALNFFFSSWTSSLLGLLLSLTLLLPGLLRAQAQESEAPYSIAIRHKGKKEGHLRVFPSIVIPGDTITIFYQRMDLKDEDVTLHLGLNGWRPLGPGSFQRRGPSPYAYALQLPMRWNEEEEAFEARYTVPVGTKALHMAFCYNRCRTWDNNNQEDYSWPVDFPYIGPILTWNHRTSPDTGLVISFVNSFSSEAWLEYWPKGQSQSKKRVQAPQGTVHRFVLSKLSPATSYEYQVGIEDFRTSAVYGFTTAPPLQGLEDLSFIVLGDIQDDGENGQFQRIVGDILRHHQDAHFLISTGDLTYNDRPGDWWTLFDKGKKLFASKVMMPAVGNHDTPTHNSHEDVTRFARYFALPQFSQERTYYGFRYGPATFYALNSDRPHEMKENGGQQFSWLKGQLRMRKEEQNRIAGESTPWTFAYWHVPPFNLGQRHWREQNKVRSLVKLFNGTLDWHFGGHEHLYQRTRPLIYRAKDNRFQEAESYGTGRGQGVGYLVVPAGGIESDSVLLPADSSHSHQRALLAFPSLLQTGIPGPIWSGDTASPLGPSSLIGYIKVTLSGTRLKMDTLAAPFHHSGPPAPLQVIDTLDYDKP